MRHRLLLSIVLMGIWCLFVWAPIAAQCVMCRTQLKNSTSIEEGRHAAEGINTGILYLMFIPYVAIAILAYIWYRSAKRSRT